MADGWEGLANFRDLGGRPVDGGGEIRAGRLFRSDSLAYATQRDAGRLIGEFGVATVVDLRGPREVAERGRGLLAELDIGYLHVPISDVSHGVDLSEHYVAILAERGEPLADLIRRLAAPDALPAVVHCEVGCDRTGVVSATILGLVGVPDEVICADYELSSAALPALNERWRRRITSDGQPLPDGYADDTWEDRAAAMDRTVLGVRERWGDWSGWAREFGLTSVDLARLRDLLVA
jgi:protein tyrosine/serine phosphatase